MVSIQFIQRLKNCSLTTGAVLLSGLNLQGGGCHSRGSRNDVFRKFQMTAVMSRFKTQDALRCGIIYGGFVLSVRDYMDAFIHSKYYRQIGTGLAFTVNE